jgi:DNA excision repair protein ERCC-5
MKMAEGSLGGDQNAESVRLNSVPPLNLKCEDSDARQDVESNTQDGTFEANVEEAGREVEDDGEQLLSDWSPSPSAHHPVTVSKKDKLDWDATQEMDVEAEEWEFAEFLSKVKGKDLNAVREEIDAEIRQLNKEKKNAQRDSEDMNQATVAQIMVRDCYARSRT